MLIFGLGLAIVAALAWVALRPVPVPVEVAAVTRGPMEVTVDVDGVTRIREVWEVSAPIAGTALRSPVRVGDRVIAGETLVAVVEPVSPSLLDERTRMQAEAAVHEASAALAVSESQLRQAEEDLAHAQSQYERAKALVERGVASLVQLEDVTQTLRIKEAARDAAASARTMATGTLERARAALIGPETGEAPGESCCVRIMAPASGRVLSIDRVSERTVLAGERLLSIGDPQDLEIAAELLSRDAVQVPAEASAHVLRWGGAGDLSARLRRIEPSARTEVSALGIEEQRVDALFDLTDPPEARRGLGDGYAVRLHIVIWSAPSVLRVPVGAIFREGGDWATFVLRDGRASLTPLELGRRNDREAEVLSGLEEGDEVILHPGETVADGVLATLSAHETP
ncbi:HlyD family efflux transporter periplasmic adaptor subunit [Aquicoccus sp. SCR17]|nr:HlyD family efflux transporter periplasmic adaptor subunit [Carideicomes alvinocaridis]